REAAADQLGETLPLLAHGHLSGTPQDEALATCFGRRTPADGLIDWALPASQLYNLIRAVTQPYPGSYNPVGENSLIVWA
ncbi:bifunctional UDP-glucuronic acid oxidase/UDP-4-amino-4-deoxy-L-arabinose formyltransferase, partial [Pseudomonas syringae pv. tagetis]